MSFRSFTRSSLIALLFIAVFGFTACTVTKLYEPSSIVVPKSVSVARMRKAVVDSAKEQSLQYLIKVGEVVLN